MKTPPPALLVRSSLKVLYPESLGKNSLVAISDDKQDSVPTTMSDFSESNNMESSAFLFLTD